MTFQCRYFSVILHYGYIGWQMTSSALDIPIRPDVEEQAEVLQKQHDNEVI
ncbi:MAG: hypothetical protein IKI30_00340 [Oxalobacter sp.]|nr:hypothetical protein [Oxalobacter sp.]